MNDAPRTGTFGEASDLARRLADLAATTKEDPEAWTKFRQRVAREPTRRGLRGTRHRWRLAAAAAAAAVLAVALGTVAKPGGQIFTGDDDSRSTTTDHDNATTTTSTTAPGSPTTTIPPASVPPSGSQLPGTDSGAPGTPPLGSQTNPGSPGSPGSGPTTTTTSPGPTAPVGPTAPDGRVVAVTYDSPAVGLATTAWVDPGARPNTLRVSLWMTDPYRAVTTWGTSSVSGQDCLLGTTFGFGSGDDQHHVASFGFVRSDAAQVRVILASGDTTSAAIGSEAAPGLRVWLAEHPEGEVDRFEVLASNGDLLHTARYPAWNSRPDSC